MEMIRPTSDRVRETLFNWLMHDIHGARCLDLFAGSGALGFEALSRGADSVTLVEQNPQIADSIRDNLAKLEANRNLWKVETSDAYRWLADNSEDYDIVFLDPPFTDDRIHELLTLIADSGTARHYIYIETVEPLDASILPAGWQIKRQKRAGAAHYALCSVISD